MPLHDEMQTEFQTIKTLTGMFIGAVCGVYQHLSDNFVPYHTQKVPKFSDAAKPCYNLPKIQTNKPNLRVFRQKDAKGIAKC